MAVQPLPFRRTLAANAVVLAPSFIALTVLYWFGQVALWPALLAFAGIVLVTVFLVQRYMVALDRFVRFVGDLSGEQEPAIPRFPFAVGTEELTTAATTLA